MAKTFHIMNLAVVIGICGTVGCAQNSSSERFRLDNYLAKRNQTSGLEQTLNSALNGQKPSAQGSTYQMKRSPSDYFVNSKKHKQSAISSAKKFAGKKPTAKERFQSVASSMHGKFSAANSNSTRIDGEIMDADDPTSLTSDPGRLSAKLYLSSAALHEKNGKIDQAVAQYRKLLAVEPTNRSGLIGLARLQNRAGATEESFQTYQQARKIYPNDEVVMNDYGLALAKHGKLEEAIEVLQAAIRVNPNASIYRNNLAAVFVETNQPNQALTVLSDTYGPAIGNYNVGFLMKQRGDLASAKHYLAQALGHNPSLSQAQAMLFEIEAATKQESPDRIAKGTPTPEQSIADADASERPSRFYEVYQARANNRTDASILPTYRSRSDARDSQIQRVPELENRPGRDEVLDDVTMNDRHDNVDRRSNQAIVARADMPSTLRLKATLERDQQVATSNAPTTDVGSSEQEPLGLEPEALPPIVLSRRLSLGIEEESIDDDLMVDRGVKQASAELKIPVVKQEVDSDRLDPPSPPQF